MTLVVVWTNKVIHPPLVTRYCCCKRTARPRPRARRSVDRNVLDLGLSAPAVEALEVPVDQRPQREQQLAHERVELIAQLARQPRAQRVENEEQRREIGPAP